MYQLSGFVLRSVRNMLQWNVIRFVLLLGVPFLALWGWIGYELWDYAVAVTSMVVEWIPFSIVRANGSFFIIFFIWFVLVLVSFAVLTALVGPPLLRYFKERTYYIYTFLSIILFATFWALFLIARWDMVYHEISKLLLQLPFQTVAEGFAGLLAFFIFYNLFILTLFVVVSFFRKGFLEPLRQREYPDVEPPLNERLKKMHHGRMLWDVLVFLALSVLTIPILFIPVANVVALLLLWAWLYKESYFISTCNIYCTYDEYETMRAHRTVISAIAILSAMLNLLPAINLFAPFFTQIMFFHWIMEHKRHNTPAASVEGAKERIETEDTGEETISATEDENMTKEEA